MATCSVDFGAFVDCNIRILSGEIENGKALLVAEFAGPGPKCFDAGERVPIPKNIDFDFDELGNVGARGVWGN